MKSRTGDQLVRNGPVDPCRSPRRAPIGAAGRAGPVRTGRNGSRSRSTSSHSPSLQHRSRSRTDPQRGVIFDPMHSALVHRSFDSTVDAKRSPRRLGSLLDGDDDRVGDPHGKGWGTRSALRPQVWATDAGVEPVSPKRSLQLQTSRRSAAPPAASARSKGEGKATERGCHAGTRRSRRPVRPGRCRRRAAPPRDAQRATPLWCSPPVPAPEAVRQDGPHSRERRAHRAPGAPWA